MYQVYNSPVCGNYTQCCHGYRTELSLDTHNEFGHDMVKEGGGAVILRLTSAQYFSGMPAVLHGSGNEGDT